jgi:hypothetical protein
MKNIVTDVEVPESLDSLSESQLRILRDKLIMAGLRKRCVDLRLERVVKAFQEAMTKRSPKAAVRATKKRDKNDSPN